MSSKPRMISSRSRRETRSMPRSILMFEKKIDRNLEVFPVPAVEKVNLLEQPIFHIKLITSEYFKVIYTLLFVK